MKVLTSQRVNSRLQTDSSLETTAQPGVLASQQKQCDPDRFEPLSPPPGVECPADAVRSGTCAGLTKPAPQTDEQLLDQYRRGNRASFGILVERYHRELFHFLIRFLGNRATAEDIFQETFLQVHQSAGNFDIQRRFRPWLFTIAANKARDLIRSQARRPVSTLQAPITPGDEQGDRFIDLHVGSAELPSDSLEREELAKRVHGTVMEMTDSLREILLLAYFEQFPYKQISQILAIPLGTVKSRLHTAVTDFANRWNLLNKSMH